MGITIPLDFSNTPERGSIRVPEGDYVVKVRDVSKTKAKSSGNPMLIVNLEFLTGEFKGKSIRDNHVLTAESLWTLRNLLEAIGYKVPKGQMKFKDSMVVGKKVGITVVDGDEHKGRIKSEVADYLAPSAIGNIVRGEDADATEDDVDDEDWDDEEEIEDDELDDEEWEDDDEDEDVEEDEDEDDDDFSFDDDDEEEEDEDEEEEVELSFSPDDIEEAKGPQLKEYVAEATEAGWDLELPAKAKVAEVREALLSLFEEEEEEDDEEMEGFDIDDI